MQLLGTSILCASWAAFAQPSPRTRRIGVLNIVPRDSPLPQAFLRALGDLGYVEGRNVVVEWRSGPYEQFSTFAEDLVRQRVDLIYAVMDPAALAASKATTTIPVVFAVIGDPVREGLVSSLAHPGGNLTGVTAFGAGLGGKRLQVLKELLPRLSRVGVLWVRPQVAGQPEYDAAITLKETIDAGRALGIEVRSVPVRRPDEIAAALEAAVNERIDGLIVEEGSLTYLEREHIVNFAAARRLPAIYGFRDYVVSGGLISYGALLPVLMRRVLFYIDKILKGAEPRALPVEQPQNFEMVINLRTAKALGLTIPQSVLLRADEVIQ